MAVMSAAGAAIVGDVISNMGQSSANASNAQQAAANREFQAQQQQQVETWETDMSNTAMQRRVADLNKAGLNPILAVSEGGASQPSVSPASGAQASYANPASAFGNLGTQISSAQQVGSQVQLQEAQADQARAQANLAISQTPSGGGTTDADGNPVVTIGPNHDLGDAQLAKIQADTGVSLAQAKQVKANIDLVNSQTDNTKIQTALSAQNVTILKATANALIQQETAKGATAANVQGVAESKVGKAVAIINAILQPISSAAGAAGNIGMRYPTLGR